MATLRSGILGQIRGKVAGVVGGQWKDKNYLREYVKPANPNTAAQQAQRGKFALCVAFAQPLVGEIFNVYMDPFLKSMSGFNDFVKRNIAKFTGTIAYDEIQLTQGKLFAAEITNLTGTTGDGEMTIEWNDDLGSNGAADDDITLVLYNVNTGRFTFVGSTYARSVAGTTAALTGGFSIGDKIACYAITSRSVGGVLQLVSNSSGAEFLVVS